MLHYQRSSGFTLIELLVVIAIIGLLATVSVVSLGSARENTRNTRRIADIRQIQTALALYYNDYGHYPIVSTWEDAPEALASAEFSAYLSLVPSDPSPNELPIYDYAYQSSLSGDDYQIIWYLTNDSAGLSKGYQAATPERLGSTIEISDTGLIVKEDDKEKSNNGIGQWLSDLIRTFLGVKK